MFNRIKLNIFLMIYFKYLLNEFLKSNISPEKFYNHKKCKFKRSLILNFKYSKKNSYIKPSINFKKFFTNNSVRVE